MAESLIKIATARGVVQISHEEAFEHLSILLAEDFLEQMEESDLGLDRPESPRRSAARLLQFAIDEKLTVPVELSRSEKRVLYKTLDDSRRTGGGFGGHPRLDELWFSLHDELADDLEERQTDGGYV